MKFSIYQESRIGKRANNEDRMAHCYSRDALMLVIADGMGGHHYGEVAAQIAVQTFGTAFQKEARPGIKDPEQFLQSNMLNAHNAIYDFAFDNHLKDMPRTTCVACIVQNNLAYWAHSGDSRLYLVRNGKVLYRTRDHSRIQLLQDQGIITAKQAAVHPDRNKIYSSLGGTSAPEVDFSRKTPLVEGDVLLLCTDGVWGVLPEKLMAGAFRASDDITQTGPSLLDKAEMYGGPRADNLSLIAVRWDDTYAGKRSRASKTGMSTISTHAMSDDAITTQLDKFATETSGKDELSEKEIERAIAEIQRTIQKYTKK